MTRPRMPIGVLVIVGALVGGCGSGTAPGTAPATASSPAASTAAPAPTPTPVVEPIPEVPPDVSIVGEGGAAIVGDLGTFEWDGLVSDSPWILGRAAVAVPAGGRLEVDVAGRLAVRGWVARWARIVDGDAQPVEDAAAGGFGLPIVLEPPGAGAWSLRLEVAYADVGRANWFWRVTVAP